MVTFDRAKSQATQERRGLSFDMVERFDWSDAVILEDLRRDYGERRFRAIGTIDGEHYAVVFTPRDDIHVISLRRANKKERRLWHANQTPT
jgi:uncharacterized DUF497 family protein